MFSSSNANSALASRATLPKSWTVVLNIFSAQFWASAEDGRHKQARATLRAVLRIIDDVVIQPDLLADGIGVRQIVRLHLHGFGDPRPIVRYNQPKPVQSETSLRPTFYLSSPPSLFPPPRSPKTPVRNTSAPFRSGNTRTSTPLLGKGRPLSSSPL